MSRRVPGLRPADLGGGASPGAPQRAGNPAVPALARLPVDKTTFRPRELLRES